MGKRTGNGLPSQRQLRVGEQMRHLLAGWLLRGEIHDPRLDGVSVTVSEVRVSRDLRDATVFASELGRGLSERVAAALRAAAPRMAGRLAREMHLKYAPRLRFVADTSFEEADRIERLLRAGRARAAVTGEDGEPT
jgi:ribosome-binding factor A